MANNEVYRETVRNGGIGQYGCPSFQPIGSHFEINLSNTAWTLTPQNHPGLTDEQRDRINCAYVTVRNFNARFTFDGNLGTTANKGHIQTVGLEQLYYLSGANIQFRQSSATSNIRIQFGVI